MKKFISLAFCAVAAGVVAFKMHSLTAVASSPAVGTSVIAQSSSGDSGQENTVIDKVKKANKVIVPNNKERSTTPELTLEQAKALEGTVTNQYGIRDDIYEYIETHIPKDNPEALKAAIKLAQYDNQIYYHAASKKQAIEMSKQHALALHCLALLLPKDWDNIYKKMHESMHDTSARDKRIWDIDEKYFGWEVLGTGLTTSDEDKQCKSGKF